MTLRALFTVRTLLTVGVLAALSAGLLSCQRGNGDNARYRTEPLSVGPITQSVAANGTLNPVTLVSVGTQVSGTVNKLYVDFNQRVQQGQVLMTLDDALLRAELAQAEANITAARATLELARSNRSRIEALAKEGFASQQEQDQARQAVRDGEARLAQAQAQSQRSRANLGYSVIRSPVAGVVVAREVDVGQTVAASFQTPTLFKIARDLREMQIDAYFAEADIGQVKVGQPVKFRVDAYPNRRFSGAVKQIRLNPKTESNVVTYDVVVSVANPDELLLPGMTAYVDVVVSEKPQVLRVPNAALRFRPAPQEDGRRGKDKRKDEHGGREERDEHSATVHVLNHDQLKALTIRTGIADRRYTEVLGGLPATAGVVVEDSQILERKREEKGFRMGLQ